MISHAAANGIRRRQPELAGRLFAPTPAARLFGPGLGTRVAARMRGDSLDHALAAGADPAECPRLAARAALLTSRSVRSQLADTLERFVLAAELPGRFAVRPAQSGLLANRDGLIALIMRLREDGPVYARGVAELKLALRDGAGPLYLDRRGEAIARQLQIVGLGLRG